MPNEITAEMLAREMSRVNGQDPDALEASSTTTGTDLRMVPNWSAWASAAASHILATRAHAALMAERSKDAPEQVRCWMVEGVITNDENYVGFWRGMGIPVTPGWFTPDTKGSTDD